MNKNFKIKSIHIYEEDWKEIIKIRVDKGFKKNADVVHDLLKKDKDG